MRRTPASEAASPSLQLPTDRYTISRNTRKIVVTRRIVESFPPRWIGLCFSEQSTPPLVFAGQDKFFQCFFQTSIVVFHVAWGRTGEIPFLWLVKLARMVFFQVCNLDFRIIFAFLKMPGDAIWCVETPRREDCTIGENPLSILFLPLARPIPDLFRRGRFRQATSCHGFPTRPGRTLRALHFLIFFQLIANLFQCLFLPFWPIFRQYPMFLQVLMLFEVHSLTEIFPRSDPSLLQNGSSSLIHRQQ